MKLSFAWVFAAFLADLFSLFILADAIGAWWTLLWVLLAMILGVLVILDAGDTLRSLGGVFVTPSERVEAIKETPWMLLVGILFFIPGVLSDIAAVLFWLPTLRKKVLRPKMAQSNADTQKHSESVHYQQDKQGKVIIEGEFVEKPNSHLPPHQ